MTETPDPTPTYSRRRMLQLTGAATTATVVGTGSALALTDEGWTVAETPTENALYDVVRTVNGLYAVGGGGVVLCRRADGWVKILDGGPAGNGDNLYGADVTDDGKALWFVGASGAIGEYDVVSGVLTNYSAPMDVTNNFNDVSAQGESGSASVYVAGDSGKIYHSFESGETGTWDDTTPGSGSAITAIDFHDDRFGHAVDDNQTVFETDDGVTYRKLGIENADYNFYGVDSDSFDDVTVSGGGGSVYHWDGAQWVRDDTGDAGLQDVEAGDVETLTVGESGAVFREVNGTWRRESTPTGENLKAVVLGEPEAAVGASGIVIER